MYVEPGKPYGKVRYTLLERCCQVAGVALALGCLIAFLFIVYLNATKPANAHGLEIPHNHPHTGPLAFPRLNLTCVDWEFVNGRGSSDNIGRPNCPIYRIPPVQFGPPVRHEDVVPRQQFSPAITTPFTKEPKERWF